MIGDWHTWRDKSAMILAVVLSTVCCEAAIDFEKDVRPIFKNRCAECHGADSRKGGLRLSNRDDAFMPGDSAEVVIEKGNAAGSLLFQRITEKHADERMPKDAQALPEGEIAIIRQWINEGAEWPDDGGAKHWAYVKPVKADVALGARNPVDYFIGQQLEKRGLSFSASADPARLIRRVSLDLTGLPPALALVDRFAANPTQEEYLRIVDELLESPRFGEHWAQQWLDIARYADSNGYQADQLRDSWAYRDWVIGALNKNMPFDQFTIEQIAGDLLPNATTAQRIATGFHRTVTCNVEAGVDPEENRVNQVFDRVNTTATAWLGATFECAQCHNHKYDPFTAVDYYKLFAYFNNTPLEVKQHSGVRYDFIGPKMMLPFEADKQNEHETLTETVDKLAADLKKATGMADARLAKFEQAVKAGADLGVSFKHTDLVSFDSEGGAKHTVLEDGSVLVSGKNPDTDVYTVKVKTTLSELTGIKIQALTHASLPGGKGPGRQLARERGNFVITDLSVSAREEGAEGRTLSLHSPEASFAGSGHPVTHAIDGSKETGWSIHTQYYQNHFASFQFGKPVGAGKPVTLTLRIEQKYGQQRQMGRFKIYVAVGDFNQPEVSKSIRAIVNKEKAKRSKAETKKLASLFQEADPELKRLQAELKKQKQRLAKLEPPSTLVMVELNKARETHVLKRGNFLSKGKRVEPGVPVALHPLAPNSPPNRLGLAKWLVSPENPLVGRVTVNRWWHQIMGRGIVPSLEDLGTQSDLPTHPELLDWMAVEFVEKGWSMKHMLRLMVTSQTYQQSARISPSVLEKDASNQYFARGPRFRMSAEMIRDNSLAISGLLSAGGEGVPIYPPQPEGTWRTTGRNAPSYVAATDHNRFRRGVYVIWRRSAPFVGFVNFDAPDRASCTVSRTRTNTPLQALTLLNDKAYVEMGLGLARRMMTEKGTDPDARLQHGFRLCMARTPKAGEMASLRKAYAAGVAHYKERPEAAKALLSAHRVVKMPKGVSASEAAAWFYVANILLNLDEVITRG